MNRQNLLESIAETIKDYRLGEIPPITADHVNRWVCQFDDDEQLIILDEMDYLLKKYYVSKAKAKEFLETILASSEIFGDKPAQNIQNTQFLNIQRKGKGNSQKDLLQLANEISMSKYGISINQGVANPISYVYLDDCLFSGSTVYYDIETWLENNNISNTTIHLIFFAVHSSGLNYYINGSNGKLNKITQSKNISLKVWHLFKFNNDRSNQGIYECLWSIKIEENQFVNDYVSLVKERIENENKSWIKLFRPDNIPLNETLFSLPQNRDTVEKAFLKKGAYIYSFSKKHEMRPMGYEKLESLGFGSIFITYRNIANNCPLVLWWGDPNHPNPNHPFRQWNPLFPRKVNEKIGIDIDSI